MPNYIPIIIYPVYNTELIFYIYTFRTTILLPPPFTLIHSPCVLDPSSLLALTLFNLTYSISFPFLYLLQPYCLAYSFFYLLLYFIYLLSQFPSFYFCTSLTFLSLSNSATKTFTISLSSILFLLLHLIIISNLHIPYSYSFFQVPLKLKLHLSLIKTTQI